MPKETKINRREILIAAATNPSLVRNEAAVNAANRVNDIIKEHVNGDTWNVPLGDSFFGRLKSIQSNPNDKEGAAALSTSIGKDRQESSHGKYCCLIS